MILVLPNNNRLETLTLDRTHLTDDAVRSLARYITTSGIMTLRIINLRGNADVTAEGIEALRAACRGRYPIELLTE